MEDTSELRAKLEANDVRSALAYLNGRTPHRFTSLFLFHTSQNGRSYFFDREQPGEEHPKGLPELSPYCVFVRKSKAPIELGAEDVGRDDPVQSFVGVPITDLAGHVLGSLCHFDFAPHPASDETAAYLDHVAPLFLPLVQKV